MSGEGWHDLGPVEEFQGQALTHVEVGRTQLAISYKDGTFGAINGVCNHVGGPLGRGRLDGDYVVCPWHYWTFHRETGEGEPGYEDAVPSHEVEVRDGHLWVNLEARTTRRVADHEKHPLDREPEREPGRLRVVGISTTVMDEEHPRTSTSEELLRCGLAHAEEAGAETRLIRLSELGFRACEGFYSKSARACTWPCSITQMDPEDELDRVYEAVVFWADVILIATPIRWGQASSLYFKMVERFNCVQNQITIKNRVMMRNKTAAFIITGGQDNVQAVAGEMMTFFAELGCHFPQFPFIGHSRGWEAEDMERNVDYVMQSEHLRQATRELVGRALEQAHTLVEHAHPASQTERHGRKAGGLVEEA
ncbi:MAG: NAD(P)H-dependent oxidoreductase, partial [Candidatus Thermoplasmatota archaeon]|nr:NAD(P)H-dependent oxidoreductase [Candidatus Thermoplasmatota archaeon]